MNKLPENWEVKLLNAVTEYDRKQSLKKHYNPYALCHYCGALAKVRAAVETGVSLREAIINNFLDRLQTAVLKAVGEKSNK